MTQEIKIIDTKTALKCDLTGTETITDKLKTWLKE